MEYPVVVEKEFLEPYTVSEEVEGMGRQLVPDFSATLTDQLTWVPVPRMVTKEVTKTRLVTRPIAETQTKRVSSLRYLLR